MKNKSNVFDMFKLFVKENETQFHKRIKCFRSNKGTEYGSHTFNEYYKELVIIQQTTALYFPEMNGKSERKNRTFTELVVSIMLNSSASPHWWGKILLIVCYVVNRVPKRVTLLPMEF